MLSVLSKILGGLSAVLAFAVLFLRGSLANEKAERKQEELKRAKALQRSSEKATDALVEGLENESKPIERGHYNKPD